MCLRVYWLPQDPQLEWSQMLREVWVSMRNEHHEFSRSIATLCGSNGSEIATAARPYALRLDSHSRQNSTAVPIWSPSSYSSSSTTTTNTTTTTTTTATSATSSSTSATTTAPSTPAAEPNPVSARTDDQLSQAAAQPQQPGDASSSTQID